MSLKAAFIAFAHRELQLPLVGIAGADDFTQGEIAELASFKETLCRYVPLPKAMRATPQPAQMLDGARSIIITAMPNYMNRPLPFSQCREKLLGTASALHVTPALAERRSRASQGVCAFFTERGYACLDLSRSLSLPVKLVAARCGIGWYGRNSMIINREHGSWMALSGFVTDAPLDPDAPVAGSCGDCDLCMRACPAGALSEPYKCDTTRCVNFHLVQNRQEVPEELRPACRNVVAQGCTVCKDVCPKNSGLVPLPDLRAPQEMLNPSLEGILALDQEGWERTYGPTVMGAALKELRYLKRNACIALGNFKDARALPLLEEALGSGDDLVASHAAWAMRRIDGP